MKPWPQLLGSYLVVMTVALLLLFILNAVPGPRTGRAVDGDYGSVAAAAAAIGARVIEPRVFPARWQWPAQSVRVTHRAGRPIVTLIFTARESHGDGLEVGQWLGGVLGDWQAAPWPQVVQERNNIMIGPWSGQLARGTTDGQVRHVLVWQGADRLCWIAAGDVPETLLRRMALSMLD